MADFSTSSTAVILYLKLTVTGNERKNLHWPSFSGLRIQDVLGLVDNNDLNIEELTSRREHYAEDVRIMFYPFRTLSGNFSPC